MAVPQSGDFPAHPTSSRLSSSGADFGQFHLLSCTLTLLVRHGLAALFFSSGLGSCTPVALSHLQAVVGQLAACGTGIALGNHHPVLLASGDQHQADQPPAPGRHRAQPAHASARRTPSSMIAGGYGLPPFSWMMMLITIPRSVAGSLMSIGSVVRTPMRFATAEA